MTEPRITGKVTRRLGVSDSWTFFELNVADAAGWPWQVAVRGELTLGDRVAVYGNSPAEAVVYVHPDREGHRVEVLPPLPMTSDTRRKLFGLFGKAGLRDRAPQLAYLEQVLGRTVESRATLTDDEGLQVIGSLEAARMRGAA